MKKKGISSQIQTRIGRTVGIIFIIVAIIVTLVVNASITDSNNTELTLESEAAAYQLSDFFNRYCSLVEGIGSNQDIQQFFATTKVYEDIATNENFTDAMKALDEIRALNPDIIQGVFIGDPDANGIIMSDDYISEKGWDMKSRPWYQATELGHTILTEPYVDVNTGGMTLTMSTPVYNNAGKLVGVAGMDIALDTIVNTVSQYKIGESGFVALLSSDGMFIYHPTSESIGKYIADMDISKEVIDAVLNKQHIFTKYKVNGDAKFGCVATVGDTGYVVISCITSSEYYQSIFMIGAMLLAVFGIGIAIIFISMRKTAAQITKPLEMLNDTAQQLAEGNLQVELNVESEDEIGELADSIGKTVARLKEYINYIDEIAYVLGRIADGKLVNELKYSYDGEFRKVKDALVNISESMIDVMQNINSSAQQVSSGSDELANAAQSLAEGAESQSVAVEELLATAVAVAEQVEENKNDAEASALHTNAVTTMMELSQQQMNRMREAMSNIQEASNKVVGIIKTIEDIADQTNLLSLNASIEAARAGEVGRGFAVVAGEIGNLANESARAVNTTRELIGVSLDEIKKGNAIVDDIVNSLSEAVGKVEEVNEMIQKTADNAVVQMQSMNQIKAGVEEMSHGIQDNSAMAEETSATSEELAAQVITLNELVSKFELN